MKTQSLIIVASATTLAGCAAISTLPPEQYARSDAPHRHAQIVDGFDAQVDEIAAEVAESMRDKPAGLGSCKVEVINTPDPQTFERRIRTDCLGQPTFDAAVLNATRSVNNLRIPRYRFIVSTPQYRGSLNWSAQAGRGTITYYADVPADTPMDYGEPYEAEAQYRRFPAQASLDAMYPPPPPVLEETPTVAPTPNLNPPIQLDTTQHTPSQAPKTAPVISPPHPRPDEIAYTPQFKSVAVNADPIPLIGPQRLAVPAAQLIARAAAVPASTFALTRARYHAQQASPVPEAIPPRPFSMSLRTWQALHGNTGWTISVLSSGQPIDPGQRASFAASVMLSARNTGPGDDKPYRLMLLPTDTEQEAIDQYVRATGSLVRPARAWRVSELVEVGFR